jgi:putative ABC transport system permease protein
VVTRTRGPVFWVRWSLRDLRRRWQLVLAIALLIAMGTGLATGLGSMESWRVRSADASYAALHAHDLRVTLSEGSYVPTGTLGRAVRGSAVARLVDRAEERLVVGTQVDASSEGRVVLTAARMIGVPLDDADSPVVDALSIDRGHGLVEGSDGVVVESKYADYHGLRAPGVVRVAGARRLEVVGHGTSPDTFLVIPPAGLFGGEASFAVVWAPLALAQEAGGVGDRVNELVLTVVPSADVATVERGLRDALRGIPGDVGATLMRQEDEDVHRILYEDAANDQQFMTVFAVLVLAGAAFGAFNLVTRIVEAQRREIGIGMALGVSSGRLAIRPLLLAAEVALLGVLLGVAIGLGMGRVLGGVLADLLPLPVTETPFEPGVFARGALLGFLVPFVAALYPVIRGVGMRPVEAIEVGLRSARSSPLLSVVGRVPLPVRSVARLSFRNVVRTPRRTLLTSLALAAVTAVLVTMLGTFDSFDSAIDAGEREIVRSAPERVTAQLSSVVPVGSPLVRSVGARPAVGLVSPTLRVSGSVRSGASPLDVALVLLDPQTSIWLPTVLPGGTFTAGSKGILLARKAARDLGVGVGDTVTLRHPRRTGARTFAYADTTVRVVGLHPSPFRVPAYMDIRNASLLGLQGTTNTLEVLPARDRSSEDVMRALFPLAGVASVERASTTIDTLRDSMDDYTAILRVTELAALALVLLLAFNATGIAMEERVREHATMLAFGLPVRSIVGSAAVENALVGLLGTLVGLALGSLVVRWMTGTLLPEVLPEAEVRPVISAGSVAVTLAVGVGAMALAPLFTLRRLVRLDVPSALRVVE